MTLNDWVTDHLESVAMIELVIDSQSFQYNYWNWLKQNNQLHLLKDDYSIGHIIHSGTVFSSDDGGIINESVANPKKCKMNIYFGKAIR